MEFDNATSLDRKSGVRGTKKRGRSPTIALALTECDCALQGKQWKPIIIIPGTLGRGAPSASLIGRFEQSPASTRWKIRVNSNTLPQAISSGHSPASCNW